jgi:hypothetical protein
MSNNLAEALTSAIELVDSVRTACVAYVRANPQTINEGAWLRNIIHEFDLFISPEPDGIHCSGSAISSLTCDTESYSFVVPYSALGDIS